MDIKVFYAWQDDRPGKINRYLIRDAVKEACQQITDDKSNEYNLSLDESTIGVGGMCDIPNEILKKIRPCDIFLVDLTFVGKSDIKPAGERLQLISNPNVIMELGYDVGSKANDASDGFEQVIAVMNTAYGPPDEQMFDIKRRHPIIYNLPEGSDKITFDNAKTILIKDLKDALIIILQHAVFDDKNKTVIEKFGEIRTNFETLVRDGNFNGLFHSSCAMTITLAPSFTKQIDFSELRNQIHNFLPLGSDGGNPEIRGKSILYVSDWDIPNHRRERMSVTEVTLEGIVFGADVFLFYRPPFEDFPNHDNFIVSKAFENNLVRAIVYYSTGLKVLGVPPPWHLGISLLGVRNFYMYVNGLLPRDRNSCKTDDIICDPLIIRNNEDVGDFKSVGHLLKDTFDYIWREFGLSGSKNYDNKSNWLGPW